MISRSVFSSLLFRNISFNCQKNSTLKSKLDYWKEFNLFHVSSVPFLPDNKKLKNKVEKKKVLVNPKIVKIWKSMTVRDICKAFNIGLNDLGFVLPEINVKPDSEIKNFDVFFELANKLNLKVVWIKKPEEVPKNKKKDPYVLDQLPVKSENLVKRPPVVTVMGHVDHGKTTLLDSIRNSFVAEQEFGGITQHIGAFSVEVKPGEKITFIDTPGHAAFTTIRARGAEVTDIVVLVIAADDGVMEQTVESIRIAKAAGVHIIIAVNKIDKVKALSIDKIKENLLLEGIQVEDQGGDIQLVPISALKKINLDLLTEIILFEAEAMNLKADPTGLVEAVVIESKKDKMGIVATVIVKRGTLRKKKILVAGKAHARVRKMLDENGKECEEASPSTPVLILGWKELPLAGDKVMEVTSEKKAAAMARKVEKNYLTEKQEAEEEIIKKKAKELRTHIDEYKQILLGFSTRRERRKFFYENKHIFRFENNTPTDSVPILKILLKGDVYGTLEVLVKILGTYNKDEECKLSIVDATVGDISPKDLELAEFFEAIIYAFNVNLHETAINFAKEKNTNIRFHNVIYKLIDDLKGELNARILPKDEEQVQGEAEVLENFMISYANKKVPVAGARCTSGQLNKESLYKVLRNGEVIYTGKLKVMKNEKKVVKTILKGMECGLLFDSFPDKFKPGDKIICYDMIKVFRQTTWDPGF